MEEEENIHCSLQRGVPMSSRSGVNLREYPNKSIAGQKTRHDTLVVSESELSVAKPQRMGILTARNRYQLWP
jgi:hypothetical protein